MDARRLSEFLRNVDKVDLESLKVTLDTYPYCQTLWLLYLKYLFHSDPVNFEQELPKAAVFLSDRKLSYFLIYGFVPFSGLVSDCSVSESSESCVDSCDHTSELIDAFLNDLPSTEVLSDTLEYTPADYTSFLLDTSDVSEGLAPDEETHSIELINDFLKRDKRVENELISKSESLNSLSASEGDVADCTVAALEACDVPEEDLNDDDSYFTETLAKIYIKQHRYSKALEIIKKLSLKYPKKNTYFADQIRFLEKLIINAKSK